MKKVMTLAMVMIMMPMLNGSEYRTWTEAKTGKTIDAKIVEKNHDGRRVRLLIKKGSAKWMTVSRLTKEDQQYVADWTFCSVQMRANTVAASSKRHKWSSVWGTIDQSGAEIAAMTDEQKNSRRVVGVFFNNTGDTEDFVIEVYWLGFPLDKKTKRAICAMSACPIKIPSKSRSSIAVSSSYNYRDTSLLYLQSNGSDYNWEGWYVRMWSGYGYAGWAIRLSDGKGNLIAESAAQPPFLRYIGQLPIPTIEQ